MTRNASWGLVGPHGNIPVILMSKYRKIPPTDLRIGTNLHRPQVQSSCLEPVGVPPFLVSCAHCDTPITAVITDDGQTRPLPFDDCPNTLVSKREVNTYL